MFFKTRSLVGAVRPLEDILPLHVFQADNEEDAKTHALALGVRDYHVPSDHVRCL